MTPKSTKQEKLLMQLIERPSVCGAEWARESREEGWKVEIAK